MQHDGTGAPGDKDGRAATAPDAEAAGAQAAGAAAGAVTELDPRPRV
jgi:hypothetical protein